MIRKLSILRRGLTGLAVVFFFITRLAGLAQIAPQTESFPPITTTEFLNRMTSNSVIVELSRISVTNCSRTNSARFRLFHPNRVSTNSTFIGYLPESLGHLVWTNFIANTNGRELRIWSERVFPARPGDPFRAKWNHKGLMWGMKGLTGLAPNWEGDLGSGQSPVTALTRRHGYTRGHGMGLDGITTNRIGLKVWFVTTNDEVVEVKIKQSVVRTHTAGNNDYTILLFDRDLPAGIEPMRVTTFEEIQARYRFPRQLNIPHPIFMTEQTGYVSASVPPLIVDVGKGGDSGSPNLLPLPGELVFFSGRSTTGPSPEMEADLETLCRMEKLDPRKYRLQRVDLKKYPSY